MFVANGKIDRFTMLLSKLLISLKQFTKLSKKFGKQAKTWNIYIMPIVLRNMGKGMKWYLLLV